MIGIAIFFIVLGILIKYGKMYSLIAGYNTLPKEKKSKYNVDRIATVFRNGMFGMAFIIVIGHTVAKWLENPHIATFSMYGALLVGILYILIRSNSVKYNMKDR